MAKELIVSVNGREKKIAILENDQVTEFYIERGEEHQGIVGNIYKGRVMRVLPGMQSAFVDVGLERDAFLYVSDFFDEEEEFERIVLEKSKKGDHAAAARAAAERIEKARLERERQMEAAQEKGETLDEIVADEPTWEAVTDDEFAEAAPVMAETAEPDDEPRGRRRRRRRGRGETHETEPSALAEASSFERIVDDEAEDFTNGEMLKDALIQERLTDEVRAFEFEMDAPAAPSVSFERVADEDDAPVSAPAPPVKAVVAQAALFVDDAETAPAAPVFERVADDDDAPAPDEKAGRGKSRRSRGGKGKKTAAEPPVVEAAPETVVAEAAPEPPAKPEKPATRSRSKKGAEKKAAPAPPAAEQQEVAAEKTAVKPKKSSRQRKAKGGDEPLADAEAKVTESAAAAEFATRRGGRRRRRPRAGEDGGENGGGNGHHADGGVADEESEPEERKERGGRGRGRRERNERSERPPAITDLLREGQEILVQIAKEPIARKGARITSHIALPGRFLVYMPTVEHVGVSRKIDSDNERARLRKLITAIRQDEDVPSGGFIVRTAGIGISEEDLRADARYLVRTWQEIRRQAERAKPASLVHRDLDLVQRILRDQLSDDFAAIRVDSEEEYREVVEFINRIQPRLVKRVKLYTRETPILEAFGVQEEIDKAIKPRVWLKSGGYLVINQTEALVSIDVNTGKFVGRGNARLEDTITRTNLEAVDEIARQIRLRDLGGILVLDLIDMEDRRNRQKVLNALHDALQGDKSPTKVLSFNDFGLVIMTRKRVKQSLERTLCAPCAYCQGAGLIKSAQTICYEILEEARRLARGMRDEHARQTTLRVHPEVARALRSTERDIFDEVEDYLGAVDLTSDQHLHQEQFDFAFV
jgi:ribonuclease G